MSLTSLALSRTRVASVLIAVLLLSGVSAYFAMPQQMDPGFLVRNAQVVTVFPGASPDRVEKLVTDPIEQAVQAMPELDFVSSVSRTGVSVVKVAIREEFRDIRPIWDSLRRKIGNIEDELPSGIVGPSINDELGDIYPVMFSMTAEGWSPREMSERAETIRDALLHIKGVGKVELLGLQDERVFVEYSNSKLAQLGLSPQSLQDALRGRNIIMPGGAIEIGPERIALEPTGNFTSVDDLSRTLIALPAGGVAYLGDFTEVRRGYVEPRERAVTLDGKPAVTIAVSMADGNNLVALGEEVKQFFDDLEARSPWGIHFETTYFQPAEVSVKVSEFLANVVQAVAIVLVVMLLALGLRTGLVVSTLIPTAMIITLWVLDLTGETINQMSLAALIIALGLLVDNAIVVSEAILVRMQAGESATAAAIASCRELQVPLLVSSLTTAAAFLPIYLAESAVGEYTGALFTVVSITLLVSWCLAMTMTPMLCVRFLKAQVGGASQTDRFAGRFYQIYRQLLGGVLRNRVLSLVVVVAAFAGSLPLWSMVPQIFFPSQERAMFMAEFMLPPGTRIEETQAMAAELDRFIEKELSTDGDAPGVTTWTTFLGATPVPFTLGYSPSPSDSGYCEMMVHTPTPDDIGEVMQKLEAYAIARFPNVQPYVRALATGPPVEKPVQIRISGQDTARIFELADQVKAELAAIPGTRNVDDDWGPRAKKLTVDIAEERARRAGVSHQDVAGSLQSFLSGLETTRYREEDESIPVVVRSVAEDRRSLDRVRNLAVFPRAGPNVPLSQVASIGLAWEPALVLRRDRYRTVTVEADVAPGTTAIGVFNAVRPWLEEQSEGWELGTNWSFGGEIDSSEKANASIGEKLPIAGLVILLLLVVQFNSLRKPLVVVSTIVLALIGVVLGLLLMRSSFGFMTLLGVVSLAGIVINNAIVLLDRIQLEISDNGLEPGHAVLEAAQQRIRPILLTTATTIASLIPLYLSGGSMWQPMAVAIMFGLAFSTALTLFVVPLLYSMLYRVRPVS